MTEPSPWPPVTFHFGDYEADHVIGDADCDACWGQPPLSPHDCGTPGCLEHTQWGDENRNGDYWLYRMGDLCCER